MNVVVYHIFCVGDYQEIVKSQLDRLKTSGVYQWCDQMEVSCVDLEGKYDGIDELFNGMDKVNLFKTTKNDFEYWGIKKVWDLSQDNDGKVLYFHAKGVSNNYVNLKTREVSEWKVEGIKLWRDALEYHLIDNYEQRIKDLDENDTIGLTCVNNWYWGNFWWANLSYIRENSEPLHGDRWYFEAWLHHARQYKTKECFHFEWNPYYSNLPIDVYTDENFFKNKDIEIISGLFGTTGIQQNEGEPIDCPKVQIDVTDKLIENLQLNHGEKLNIMVNIGNFGDPIHGFVKLLVMMIKVGNKVYRIAYNEGLTIDLKFN